jgi:hypothetical protein
MPSPSLPTWKVWNRKLHLYLGLYFLVFLWLFALSGLLLNHAWRFTEFWGKRQQSTRQQVIQPLRASDDLGQAEELMSQLNLAGEIEWTRVRPATERFSFRVVRPGRIVDVTADLDRGAATVQEIKLNGWGVVRVLHTFNGTPASAAGAERDWLWTRLWSLAMDALAVGLIVLVAGSLVLASERRERRVGAALALGLGLAVSLFFVYGLRWL